MQCPFCDTDCSPTQVRFVAADTGMGDPVLGPDAPLRFRTARFTTDGAAIAPDGGTSTTPACPTCRSAWLPELTGLADLERVDVGSAGIEHALEGVEAWSVDYRRFPTSTHPDAPDAAIVVCTKGDVSRAVLLTTRTGRSHHLQQLLSGAPNS